MDQSDVGLYSITYLRYGSIIPTSVVLSQLLMEKWSGMPDIFLQGCLKISIKAKTVGIQNQMNRITILNISVFSYKSSNNRPTFGSLYFSFFNFVPQDHEI